jgi:chemotaxis protein MotB
MIGKSVKPSRLVAAGFGEFQPIDTGTTEDAFRRNRRIEFKLTER